jgi:hypothetical protein
MAKTYDPTQELSTAEPVLGALRQEHARGLDDLLAGSDRGLVFLDLAKKLNKYLQDLPPPEPTPPLTEYVIEVEEDLLVPAQWSIWGYPKEADANHNLVTRSRVEKTVQLPDPMMPGTPEREFDVEVQIKRAFQRPTADQQGFEYFLQPQPEPLRIAVPAVPPDAPLTPIQEEYVRRKEELAAQVRDMRTFIEHYGAQVNIVRTQTDILVNNAQALIKKVDALPRPKDLAAQLDGMRQEIETLRQQVPVRQQELQNTEKELQDLKQKIQAICPELRL